jgi:transcriptional regulator with GAF, ATPase, and Fis domain
MLRGLMTTPADTTAGGATPPRDRLRSVFARVVSTLEAVFPFEHAELALLEDAETVRVLALRRGSAAAEGAEGDATAEEEAERTSARRHYSLRLWPITDVRVLSDAASELDPNCEADRRLVAAGARAVVVAPLRLEAETTGLLVLWSRDAGAFDPQRAALLHPMREFLAVAAERERLWAIEQDRARRHARLETLLPTIAESLDVRQVFIALSDVIKEVVPHDVMAFALLTPDRRGVRMQAATHRGILELPEYRFSNDEEALDSNWRHLLAYDLTPVDASSVRARISPRNAGEVVEVVTHPGPAWMRFVTDAGIRSVMRVPIRAKERPIGGVGFMSRRPDAYDEEDAVLAGRIADHVALALAHQELAEEERRMAIAEERAHQLAEKVDTLSRELDRFSAHRAIGRSPAWKNALALATQVATTDTTVLITGESGTGKEVIARFIHRGSKREKGPFVALNCAALPEQLLESELFGHERGAFTGAVEARAGKIEQAAGGVLFLDEVGEMSPLVQAKFLRVLQEREFQRVGGAKTLKADVRIVAATNRDPKAAIASGAFREDLYYRLGVFEIHLPPLRERTEDILLLAEAFLEEVGASIGRPAAGLSEDAREQLLVHGWPGNVRELKNAIERAVILSRGGLVTREHLPISVGRPAAERIAIATGGVAEFPVEGVVFESVERELLEKAMAKANQNKTQAAKLLGLSRGQLYSMLRRHGLTQARR